LALPDIIAVGIGFGIGIELLLYANGKTGQRTRSGERPVDRPEEKDEGKRRIPDDAGRAKYGHLGVDTV